MTADNQEQADLAAAWDHALHRHAVRPGPRYRWSQTWHGGLRGTVFVLRHRYLRRTFWTSLVLVALTTAGCFALWWRLSSGPIDIDVVTPWLKSAIEQNFSDKHTVAVGGTQIERDENGRTSLRLRDIVVRDVEGTVVARAPKAEVGLSGMSLLSGQVRAQSLNLVGAEMAVRIESDGRVTVFAGADNRPLTTAAPALPPASQSQPQPGGAAAPTPLRSELQDVAGALAWLDGAAGFDGNELRELGLKNGNLVVDDRRNGKQWKFDRINVSLTRPAQGGVIFRLESDNPARPWVLSAAMRPLPGGIRAVGIEARNLAARDILLALRLNETAAIDADLPLSASVRAELLPDGTPQLVQGQLVVNSGTVIDHDDPDVHVQIDHADFRFNWDAARRSLVVPFQIKSGGNQFTLRATVEPPAADQPAWVMTVARGDAVIDPIILGSGSTDEEGTALNRLAVRAKFDPVRKRFELEQGDFSRIDTRPLRNIGIAVSGSLDYSGTPHLAFGVAGTRMPMSTLKRVWPVFVAADVRAWVESHIADGTVERVVVAGNAPMADFKNGGPPTPEDGLSVDIETSGTTLRPIDNLPPIRDADLNVHITGRTAAVRIGRGTIDTGGRRLNVANGLFEIPDTHPKPAPSRTTFRVDGTMPAAAALLSSDGLRDNVGITLDPAATRGTIAAMVTVNVPLAKEIPPGAVTYSVAADLTNFAADKILMGQKLEANALHLTAGNDGYQVKGDVKINGTAANIDLRRQKGEPDAELRMSANIDDAARRRIGMDLGSAVTGAIPVKAVGRVGDNTTEERLSVDADLTPVKIDNLLPGWLKAAGKQAHASYTMIKTAKSTRLDDLSIDGSGASVKGSVEIDSSGDVLSANFPVFSLSDGDKASIKADRTDNVLRVVMRGDVYDGRQFVKASLAGGSDKNKQKQADLDLDIKLGTVVGHNGETLRGLDLKMTRRSGRIRTFSLASKIGRDTPLIGDLRVRARDSHQVVYFETDDAGALFRFTDMYPRMYGGHMWVAMDPPSQDEAPQVGHLALRSFVVRGEPALDRVVSGAPNGTKGSVEFSELGADFTKSPGHMSVREGVVRGPLVGATIEGQIDYVRDDLHLRGTFVPFYGLNNMFGQLPIVGMFLGGSNEGLLGITYEATGSPSAPRVSVNPVTAIAPGLLRKFIPSPGSFDSNFVPQTR